MQPIRLEKRLFRLVSDLVLLFLYLLGWLLRTRVPSYVHAPLCSAGSGCIHGLKMDALVVSTDSLARIQNNELHVSE